MLMEFVKPLKSEAVCNTGRECSAAQRPTEATTPWFVSSRTSMNWSLVLPGVRFAAPGSIDRRPVSDRIRQVFSCMCPRLAPFV